MKTLEDKIAGLHPILRVEVEDFVDYLIYKQNLYKKSDTEERDISGYTTEKRYEPEEPAVPISPPSEPASTSLESGIIWAEEKQVDKSKEMAAIDFADINTRFSQEKKDKSNPDSPGTGKRREVFDWL